MSIASLVSPSAPRPRSPLGRLLGSRLVESLVYPHSLDQYLGLVAPRIAVHQIRAEVLDVVRETSDVVTLVLSPTANFPGFLAGQYVPVSVEIDGVRHTRCFTLSSAPERADGAITITVKARPNGTVSSYLVEHAAKGMHLQLSEPRGDFVLPSPPPARMLFVSGGSGITPCMSILRSLAAQDHQGEVLFVHFARSLADVIFASELKALARTMRRLRVVVQTEEGLGRPPALSEASLAALAPDFEHVDAWVCGPESLMDAVRSAYAARSARGRVRSEAFALSTPVRGKPHASGALTFARSQKSAPSDGRTLLDQVEAAGLAGRRGCGMGICMQCRCKKLSGVTENLRTGQLSTEPGEEIQLCISVPVGDVTLDL
jgi:stearoyl-CoA 9-desaturase NADPH oxidoreductase